MMSFLLNPGTRRRRKSRKVGRRFTSSRRRSRRSRNGKRHKKWGKVRKHSRRVNRGRARRRSFGGRRRRKASRRRINPGRRSRRRSRKSSRRRRRNPVYWINKGRKRSRRSARRSRRSYRRNPGVGGLSPKRLGAAPFSVIPLSFGGGFIGNAANGIVQSVAGGAVFLGGYTLAGAVVDYFVSPPVAAPTTFTEKWGRPLAFASIAGIVGGAVAYIAGFLKMRNRGLITALAAAGPGVRALGGFVKALIPADKLSAPGLIGDVGRVAVGMGDFLQLGDFLQYNRGMGGLRGLRGEGDGGSGIPINDEACDFDLDDNGGPDQAEAGLNEGDGSEIGVY